MQETKTTTTRELVDKAIHLKRKQIKLKQELDEVLIQLQEEAERTLLDKKVKSTFLYGSGENKVIVTSPVKVNIEAYHKLLEIIGEDVLHEYAPMTQEPPKRVPNDKFLQVCANVVLKNYISEKKLDELIQELFEDVTEEQTAILLKKLKGKYEHDRQLLVNMFGEKDYDLELYYINGVINFTSIEKLLPRHVVCSLDSLSEAITVDENVKITIQYKD